MAEGFGSGVLEGMGAVRQQRAADTQNKLQLMKIERLQGENRMQQAFLQRMQQAEQGPGVPMSQAEKLDEIGRLQIESGMIKQGTATMSQSSLVSSRVAAQQASQARTVSAQMNAAKEKSQFMGSLMNGVNDQASWERAQTVYTMQTGAMSPYAKAPYSPELVKQLQSEAMTAYQRADLIMKQANLRATQTSRNLLDSERGERIAKMKTDASLGYPKGKAGVRTPPKPMVTLATNQIASNYSILSGDEQALLSERVAEGAMTLMAKNPALKTSEAMAQSYLARLQAGDFRNYTAVRRSIQKDMPTLPAGFVLGEMPTGEE